MTGTGTGELGYLGYSGRGNMGDDVIHDAVELLAGNRSMTVLPLYPHELVGYVARGGLRGRKDRRLVLGGGTVIGRASWRLHVVQAARLTGPEPWLMVGAGVEDPVFDGKFAFSGHGELRKWRPLLARFSGVAVRGPRSAELLADIGVDTSVVGDPALMLEPSERITVAPVGPPVLALNLGFGDDLWGHDQGRVSAEVSRLVANLRSAGWEIRPLLVNRKDRPAFASALAAGGVEPAAIRECLTKEAFFTELAGCTAVVAQRLHAVILAVAAGVPTVALEYQPKVRDFMLSVGAGDLSLRTDSVVAQDVQDRLDEVLADRPGHVRILTDAVSNFRALQMAHVGAACLNA